MSSVLFAGLLPLLLAAAPDRPESSKPADTIPAPSNTRGAEYPRIHADLRVTFRIKAPDARKVEFGFFGLGIAGYYKKNEHKISFNCSTTEDLSSPIAKINYSKNIIESYYPNYRSV